MTGTRTNITNPAHTAVQITLAPEILAEIDRLAEEDMRSRSNYVQVLVTRTIQKMMSTADSDEQAMAAFHAATAQYRVEQDTVHLRQQGDVAPDGSTVVEGV